jgi:hypothetical protein
MLRSCLFFNIIDDPAKLDLEYYNQCIDVFTLGGDCRLVQMCFCDIIAEGATELNEQLL